MMAFPGATGMALSPDGTALWVAQPDFGLVQLDTATLAVRSRVDLPAEECAGDVAVVGDRVAYGYSCNRYLPAGGGYGGIGVVDAATGARAWTVTTGPFYRPVVAAGANGTVFAADGDVSMTGLYAYDVTGSAPVLRASRPQVCSNLQDLSAAPLGGQVVTACGGTYEHEVWSAALTPVGSYFSGPYPIAGAWSGDGSVFAAGLDVLVGAGRLRPPRRRRVARDRPAQKSTSARRPRCSSRGAWLRRTTAAGSGRWRARRPTHWPCT